eukprot:7138861-Prymnesium_polylepis.1
MRGRNRGSGIATRFASRCGCGAETGECGLALWFDPQQGVVVLQYVVAQWPMLALSLIHISEPTRRS